MPLGRIRKRALLKVILFVVRVQNVCRRHKCKKCEQASFTESACTSNSSTSPSTKKNSCLSSHRNSLQVSDSFLRDSNKTKEKYLSWAHLNEEFEDQQKKISAATLMSNNRSISCTVVNRGQQLRKVSCPEPPTVVLWNEENDSPSYMSFTHMTKPYTLATFDHNDSSSSSTTSFVEGQNRCQGKNIMVSCNSVMGNPKKFGRRLIRQGSSTDLRGLDDSPTNFVVERKKNHLKPPMIRTLTADSSDLRLRCVSDENVAHSQQIQNGNVTRSPRSLQKFSKRKSSADLLDGSILDWDRVRSSNMEERKFLTKVEKKKLEKLKSNMRQFLELFTAVEQDDIGKVRVMLQYNEFDINGTNMDDMTLLDVAVMLNHNEVALLLLQHGAQENPRLNSSANRLKHIQSLVESAQTRLAEYNLQSADPACQKLVEKQISAAESRCHILKKMRNNFESSGVPRPPRNIMLRITSSTSLMISFEPPEQLTSVVTRYKVEWSSTADFNPLKGSSLIKDLRRLDVHIVNLQTGRPYYVRVSAGNFKGFGQAVFGQPEFAIPSSWREVDGKELRSNRLHEITELYHEVQSMKTSDSWEKIVSIGDLSSKRKKSSIKNYFTGGSKFQKTLKKGVYLATIMYKDDKVLCTVDDTLPVIEVDDNPPSCFQSDFLWFMKLSCSWDDVKLVNFVDFERIHHSPNLVFRWKLLEASLAMQAALGVQDLGRLHSKTISDSRGVTILVTVQHVQEPKTVQGLAVKWMPINKLFKRQTVQSNEKDAGAMELLFSNLLNFLNFYESANIPLDRGLYLGYIKLHSSMNQISLVVPENLPSVLPFVYIRSNPHVSKEEWNWLAALDTNQLDEVTPTSTQMTFHWALVSAAKMLLADLEVNPEDIPFHRIYRLEVVEIHSDVSFILLVPGHSDVCTAPGQQKIMSEEKRGCLALPVPMFEVSHFCTYQPDFIALYCRMSVFLEFYTNVLQQLQRQTLNDTETKFYKQQLDLLNGYQQRLDEFWKAIRWITPVVSAARDKHLKSGLPLSIIFAYSSLSDFGRESDREDNLAAPWAFRYRRASSEGSDAGEDNSDVGYHSDQSIDKTGIPNPSPKLCKSSKAVEFQSMSIDNPNYELLYHQRSRKADLAVADNGKKAKIFRRQFAESSSASVDLGEPASLTLVRSVKFHKNTNRRRSGSFTNLLTNETNSTDFRSVSSQSECQNLIEEDAPGCSKTVDRQVYSKSEPTLKRIFNKSAVILPKKSEKSTNFDSGVLRVYAAYPCGLTKGTSVKLHVTQKTSSKEVAALVVQQLNKSAKMKGFDSPFYNDDELADFCLVAVIGARERCLRDDFPPLDLQNPWCKGKLFVRRRHDLLAALEYGNEAKV